MPSANGLTAKHISVMTKCPSTTNRSAVEERARPTDRMGFTFCEGDGARFRRSID